MEDSIFVYIEYSGMNGRDIPRKRAATVVAAAAEED
jgi:hypothetical protein